MHDVLTVAALGPTPYGDGLRLQEALVRARADGATGDWLLYPDHPPVLTVGRNPSAGNLRADRTTIERLGVEWFEVTRGGDVTFHGPGQLVGYPIVGLERVGRDLHRWLRELEETVIGTVAAFGVAARRSPGRTGVWVDGPRGEAKLASIGVAVRRWVGWHGFALNVAPDMRFFDLIHPCGLHGIQMASLAGLEGDGAPSLAEVRDRATAVLADRLGYGEVRTAGPEAAWQAAGLDRPVAREARIRAA